MPHGTSPRKSRRKTRKISAETAVEPWQTDAAERPLGVYYRISVDSISDMQSAIAEVGAIYISADVHAGWSAVKTSSIAADDCLAAPQARGHGRSRAHIVGYDETGFIVRTPGEARGAILASPVLHTLTG